MLSRLSKFFPVLILILLIYPSFSKAEVFKLGLLHGDAEVFAYEIGVLKLALENAPGNHSLEIVPYPNASQDRIVHELRLNRGIVNVFFTATNAARNSSLLRVDIPLTRGLLGHRVFVTPQKSVARFSQITSLEDLRSLRIGSGLGWAENEIMKSANLNVEEATYKNLWGMLSEGRFDVFHRGIQEFSIELQQRPELKLTTLPKLMLVFPFDYFFFVSKANPHLHRLLQTGLENAYQNGAFMNYFNSHPAIRQAFDQGNIEGRQAIKIPNPFMDNRFLSIPDKYWHTPMKQ